MNRRGNRRSSSRDERLLQLKFRVGDVLAHFQVIFERHGGDGIGVRLAGGAEFGEHRFP